MLNCDKCDYKCKKESTLMKHIHTKHEDQKCQKIEEIFNTSMELVMHFAENHSSDIKENSIDPRHHKNVHSTDVKQADAMKEIHKNTKCFLCQENIRERNT